MKNGPRKAPTPKMNPRNCIFFTAFCYGKSLKLNVTSTMLIMTKFMEVMKRLMIKLVVERLNVHTSSGADIPIPR